MNSVEFIQKRINEGGMFGDFPKDNWDKAEKFNILEYINNAETKKLLNQKHNIFEYIQEELETKVHKKRKITVKYVPDDEYDYCVIKSSTHDGTMLFTMDLIVEVLEYICNGSTHNNKKIPKEMNINDANSVFSYDVEYIIGDALLHKDFGMKNINGHTWAGETDIIAIPIKATFKKQVQ